MSSSVARALAATFPWHRYQTFCDVEPAKGCVAVELALAHPHLQGIGFGSPAYGSTFEQYAQKHGVADRIRFLRGDVRTDPLPHADVILLRHRLHGEETDDTRRLFAKAYDALGAAGALIIFEERIEEEQGGNAFAMLLMRDGGFREARVEHLIGPESMVVAIK
jgi:hypothetical protein